MRFKIGDVVEIIKAHRRPEFIGSEATIMSALQPTRLGGLRHDIEIHGAPPPPKGKFTYSAAPENLRLKKPPEETTSWEEVQTITDWWPETVDV
jgi:hypothetical protein